MLELWEKGHTLHYCNQHRAPRSDIEQRRAEDNRRHAERAERLAAGSADAPGGPPSAALVTFLPPRSVQGEQFSTLGAQPEGRKEPTRLTECTLRSKPQGIIKLKKPLQ